jgi:hypothetical protein
MIFLEGDYDITVFSFATIHFCCCTILENRYALYPNRLILPIFEQNSLPEMRYITPGTLKNVNIVQLLDTSWY